MSPHTRWRSLLEWVVSVRSGHGLTHLSDRELVRISTQADGDVEAPRNAHLAACRHCAARARSLHEGLDRIATTAEAAFDDALPAWRLGRQRRRILDRIRRAAGRPGSARILQFPTLGNPAAANAHPIRRRLSLAAAAGLLAAIGIGQLIDAQRRSAASPRPATAVASRPTIGPPGGQPQAIADEQLMRELEEALNSSRVGPLVALDEMTPRVRAAAIDIR